MNKKSIEHETVIRQCLSLLPLEKFSFPLLDDGRRRLSTESLIKIFITAQLGKWESYSDMEEKLRAYPDLLECLQLSSISGSQLCRRINELPTEWAQNLFYGIINSLREMTKGSSGLPKGIGRLNIVDATHIKLAENLSDWAYVTKGWNVVKMHTRLVVTSANTVFPDRILPSTGNVSDYEGSDVLVEEAEATYVMDRGYACRKRMDRWIDQGISFVIRIQETRSATILERNEHKEDGFIQFDGKVVLGGPYTKMKHPVRLIEYTDEHGHFYRVATTRWDLSANQIAEIYHHRWAIELFFKWIKQHLKIVKLWSTKPQGIWNQMFLALIAYALTLMIKLQVQTKKTIWETLRLIRTYMYKPWRTFITEVFRKKTRQSKGRQKIPERKEKKPLFVGNIALIKPQKHKKPSSR